MDLDYSIKNIYTYYNISESIILTYGGSNLLYMLSIFFFRDLFLLRIFFFFLIETILKNRRILQRTSIA